MKYLIIDSKDYPGDYHSYDDNFSGENLRYNVLAVINNSNTTYVIAKDEEMCDIDFINSQDNVEFLKTTQEGGAIIIFPNDITISCFEKGMHTDITSNIVGRLTCWLNDILDRTKYTLSENNNDLLINGQKVFGVMGKYIEEYDVSYSGTFMSIGHDPELIKKICKKESVKTPIGLSELGITKEQLYEQIEIILKDIEKEYKDVE